MFQQLRIVNFQPMNNVYEFKKQSKFAIDNFGESV